jgi:F-type H+-transporting ATPase subunit a
MTATTTTTETVTKAAEVAKTGAAHAEGAAHGAGGLPSPMEQFEIHRYFTFKPFGIDASFTNSSLAMVLTAALITLFIWYAMRHRSLVPNRLQSIAEMAYEFVANIVKQTAGPDAMGYFPIVFTLFLFILVSNLLGLVNIPGVFAPFTSTSHIIVTFAMALAVFIGVTLIGIWKHGFGFLKLFVPSGVPMWLLPVLVIIEVISYFTRPISLSVRLFANMMAGHTVLKVFGGFVVGLGVMGGWAPLLVMIPFTGLEVLVAFLQAYVFAILTSIYLNDALHIHH